MSCLIPLECSPDGLTNYIHKVGVSKDWCLTDVIGLEPELLEFVPKPVKAIIFLFPCSKAYENHRAEENEKLTANPPKYPSELFYMRQFTHNACGTVALIHSLANNTDIPLGEGVLKNFLEKAKTLDPEARGRLLENDGAFTEDHQALAQEGQTAADTTNSEVCNHFIAFVNKNGGLYELDGRKSFPIKHGETSEETFVKDAANVCKEFMARDPQEIRFTVMALTATPA